MCTIDMSPTAREHQPRRLPRVDGPGGAAALALGFTILLGAGCATLNQRLLDAQKAPCGQLLEDHPELVADEGYPGEPRALREQHEGRVAYCHLDSGDRDAALELATRWSDDFDGKHRVTAIAAAQRGDESTCQAALQRFSSLKSRDAGRFFVDTPAFQRFRSRDWFVDLAARAWTGEQYIEIDRLVAALVRAGGPTLVPLHLAAADAGLRPGGWAFWIGVARGSRIDREGNQTVVYAEGVDITKQLVAIDKELESLEVKAEPGSSIFSRRYELDPTYRKRRLYIEAFKPNGHRFIVKYPQVRERLVSMPVVMAFGRYAGREGDEGPPVLDALVVGARQPRELETPAPP